MLPSTPFTRKLSRWALLPLEIAMVGTLNATVLFRFGNMQLDGLPTALGALLALLAATTSLLFNRARAYPSGRVQRRSLMAAELCLRATLLAAAGAVLAAMILPFLLSYGYKATPPDQMPTQGLPILVAFFLTGFFLAASFQLLGAARILTPTLLGMLRAKHIRLVK